MKLEVFDNLELLLSNPPQIALNEAQKKELTRTTKLLAASIARLKANTDKALKGYSITDVNLYDFLADCNILSRVIFDLLNVYSDLQFRIHYRLQCEGDNPVSIEDFRQIVGRMHNFLETKKHQSELEKGIELCQ